MWKHLIIACLAFTLSAATMAADLPVTDVFTSGTDGYAIYRIPAIVKTSSGTLLAFAEGRRDGGGDSGKIDTVLRRSTDNGATWGPLQVIWADAENTCGNPAPVVDRRTGRIILLGTWNRGDDKEDAITSGTARDSRKPYVAYSDDDGLTFYGRKDLSADVKQPDWGWYATGPCHGIQLDDGRLVIPANHTVKGGDHERSQSHVIISDDGGDTWHLGGSADDGTNESTVAQLSTGDLILNMRSYHKKSRRAVATSTDGTSWSAVHLQPELVEPICQGSLLRITPKGKPAFVFSNPASKKRERLTLRISTDDCATWSAGYLLEPGFAAYSDLVELDDGEVGCLYERASADGGKYGRICFARVPVDLLARKAKPAAETTTSTAALHWSTLPDYPDALGVAGAFAGSSRGVILAGGGANFPNGMPWENGTKAWHDDLFALQPGGRWKPVGCLSAPRGYGVSASHLEEIICAGGSDQSDHTADVFALEWTVDGISSRSLAPLPVPLANAAGGILINSLYIVGGSETPNATSASNAMYSLDFSRPEAGWKTMEALPAEGRILPAVASDGVNLYVAGGASLHTGPDGKPQRTYLRDVWCYTLGVGWKRLADLPRAAVAAPAFIHQGAFCIAGGDDGTRVNFQPPQDHPGFAKDILRYDASANRWQRAGEIPTPAVTCPVFPHGDTQVILSGEIRPGVRTAKIQVVQ